MNKPHIHADLIIEWARTGKKVQRLDCDYGWIDTYPTWGDKEKYRFKPEVKRYRVALFSTCTHTADSSHAAEEFTERSTFVRWLTDWIEYDV